MSTRRGKKVAVIAGLAVVAVAVVTGTYWRDIYYAVYPEARFWGRWETVDPELISRPITEFWKGEVSRESHRIGWRCSQSIGVAPSYTYRVTRTKIVFSKPPGLMYVNGRVMSEHVTAAYRFETDDTLVLDLQQKWWFFSNRDTLTLRRITDPNEGLKQSFSPAEVFVKADPDTVSYPDLGDVDE